MFRRDRLFIYNVFNTIFQLNNISFGIVKVIFMVSIITPSHVPFVLGIKSFLSSFIKS